MGKALLLTAATRFNAEVRAYEFSRIAAARLRRHSEAAIAAVRRLAVDLDIPANLQAIGVSEPDLPAMAGQAIGVQRLIRLNPALSR